MNEKILLIKTTPNPSNNAIGKYLLDVSKEMYTKYNEKAEFEYINLNKDNDLMQILTENNFSTFYSDGVSRRWIEKIQDVDKIIISAPVMHIFPGNVLANFLMRITLTGVTFKHHIDKANNKVVIEGLFSDKKILFLITKGAYSSEEVNNDLIKRVQEPLEFIGFNFDSLIFDGVNAKGKFRETPEVRIAEFVDQLEEKIFELSKPLELESE
ncbi:hypothetical protein CJJ23_02475 [Mycoplasmopsis agassizii]|uniref:Flavodoxin-like fold domain-containing protein n=1 Tax=Mycoplasmopsis agassizii TaxID=33922 RepID=A0A269TIS2_9BACT|nr:NAD(P)H-dependent oxidoreductase [Mycoplasmopsis agassizii]PAK21383.1 hypothetical protein CJJ23_02475 [Mycoplasmopsis agassizii]